MTNREIIWEKKDTKMYILGMGKIAVTHSHLVTFVRDTTLPRNSERESKNEGEGKSENDAFASKYCARICIARKCRVRKRR